MKRISLGLPAATIGLFFVLLGNLMPTSTQANAEGEPVIKIQKYIGLKSSDLYAALKRDLGPSASIRRDKLEGEWNGFAKIKGGHLEIFENSGRIDTINIFFEKPVKNRVIALALLGLTPPDQKPSREVPAFFAWDDFFKGIKEVRAFRQAGQESSIRGMSIRLK